MDDDSAAKPHLLVAKGSFAQFGGAERDLLNNLEAWQAHFDLSLATLHASEEVRARCEALDIPLLTPPKPWEQPTGAFAEMFSSASRTASNAWWGMLDLTAEGVRLRDFMMNADALHITSGVGSLELIDYVPRGLKVHYHCLEPHRGLYEDVLHREVDGTPRQSLALTRLLLSGQRGRDQRRVAKLVKRGDLISGNSPWIQSRIQTVYGVEATCVWPSVDTSIWEGEAVEPGDHVVSIGKASWVKGSLDAIDVLAGTGLTLHHVGGGPSEAMVAHAAAKDVPLVVEPRLSQAELVALVRSARAVISLARDEPFGLTPIEAQAAGVPALMVDEGGYRYTVEDGVSGRLLARGELEAWHAALEEAADAETRAAWAEAGRANILALGLTPADQARRIAELLGAED